MKKEDLIIISVIVVLILAGVGYYFMNRGVGFSPVDCAEVNSDCSRDFQSCVDNMKSELIDFCREKYDRSGFCSNNYGVPIFPVDEECGKYQACFNIVISKEVAGFNECINDYDQCMVSCGTAQ